MSNHVLCYVCQKPWVDCGHSVEEGLLKTPAAGEVLPEEARVQFEDRDEREAARQFRSAQPWQPGDLGTAGRSHDRRVAREKGWEE